MDHLMRKAMVSSLVVEESRRWARLGFLGISWILRRLLRKIMGTYLRSKENNDRQSRFQLLLKLWSMTHTKLGQAKDIEEETGQSSPRVREESNRIWLLHKSKNKSPCQRSKWAQAIDIILKGLLFWRIQHSAQRSRTLGLTKLNKIKTSMKLCQTWQPSGQIWSKAYTTAITCLTEANNRSKGSFSNTAGPLTGFILTPTIMGSESETAMLTAANLRVNLESTRLIENLQFHRKRIRYSATGGGPYNRMQIATEAKAFMEKTRGLRGKNICKPMAALEFQQCKQHHKSHNTHQNKDWRIPKIL